MNIYSTTISTSNNIFGRLKILTTVFNLVVRGKPIGMEPHVPSEGGYRSGTVNSKFHLIRSFCEIFARFLSFHV